MKNKKIIKKLGGIFFVMTVFFLVEFFLVSDPENLIPENIKYVEIAGENIKVDLALTPDEQAKGLSGRGELKEQEGMLFVFEKPAKHVFWMKDMNFPIDIIWLNENREIVYIKTDARPELFPETYAPNENAKYVLEVVSGFSDKNNLKVGDQVQFTY